MLSATSKNDGAKLNSSINLKLFQTLNFCLKIFQHITLKSQKQTLHLPKISQV